MANLRYCLPEHDLMIHLVLGKHDSEEAMQFIQSLDETCAMRWLCYYHPAVDVAGMDVAHIPAVKRALAEKRKDLFGDKPKLHALACASRATDQYFEFWGRYDSSSGDAARAFRSLDEAYDWLGLSEAARAAASAIVQELNAEVNPAH
jgi:hypothetical protein